MRKSDRHHIGLCAFLGRTSRTLISFSECEEPPAACERNVLLVLCWGQWESWLSETLLSLRMDKIPCRGCVHLSLEAHAQGLWHSLDFLQTPAPRTVHLVTGWLASARERSFPSHLVLGHIWVDTAERAWREAPEGQAPPPWPGHASLALQLGWELLLAGPWLPPSLHPAQCPMPWRCSAHVCGVEVKGASNSCPRLGEEITPFK